MAARDKAAKAGKAAAAAKSNPYVQRLAQDAELRENLQNAYESARNAYARLSNGKAPAKALLDDKKLQKQLKEAAGSLKDASTALREGPQRRKPGIFSKLLFVVVAGGIALAVSEGLRKKVLDALFGAEEEFEYTSPTTPTPAPSPPPAPPAPPAASDSGTASDSPSTASSPAS